MNFISSSVLICFCHCSYNLLETFCEFLQWNSTDDLCYSYINSLLKWTNYLAAIISYGEKKGNWKGVKSGKYGGCDSSETCFLAHNTLLKFWITGFCMTLCYWYTVCWWQQLYITCNLWYTEADPWPVYEILG